MTLRQTRESRNRPRNVKSFCRIWRPSFMTYSCRMGVGYGPLHPFPNSYHFSVAPNKSDDERKPESFEWIFPSQTDRSVIKSLIYFSCQIVKLELKLIPQCVLIIRCPSGTAGIFCESIISKCRGTSPCHKGTCTLRAVKKGMHGQYSMANYSFIYFSVMMCTYYF